MKKSRILSIVLCLCLSLAPLYSVTRARAADEIKYSRVESESVTLYMDSSLTIPWFTLPYGYFVKVVNVLGSCAKVEYKGDSAGKPSAKGYISVADVNFVNELPSSPYPNLTLTVNRTTLLYLDVDFSITETVTQNSTVDYYGTITRNGGSQYIYGYISASSGDKYVGYVSVDAVNDFIPPRQEFKPAADPTIKDDTKGDSAEKADNALGNNLQILLIVAISVVAASIVYFLFRPSTQKVKDEVITRSEIDDE